MKLIKKMLIAVGLLAISSMGFASVLPISHMDAGVAGSEGEIFLLQDGVGVPLSGDFIDNPTSVLGADPQTLTSSVFYGLTTGQDSSGVGFIFNVFATNPPTTGNVVAELFAGIDAVAAFGTAALATANSVFSFDLLADTQYYLRFTGIENTGFSGTISAVPVPAAGILFASALFGAGFLGRRKKKAAKANMMGAFARTA